MNSPETDIISLFGARTFKDLGGGSGERRKSAAADVEEIFSRLRQQSPNKRTNDDKISSALALIESSLVNTPVDLQRQGGLTALASACLGLQSRAKDYVDLFFPSILKGCDDAVPRVRYLACEALYNALKVTRESALVYFNSIFDALCKLFADPDTEVKSGAHFVDRLLKDIVQDSATIDVPSFIPLLAERITVKNPYIRQMIISWIVTLDSIPELDIISQLPYFFNGLFTMIADSNRDIRMAADSCLTEFLCELKSSPPEKIEKVCELTTPLLVNQCDSVGTFCRLTALVWIKTIVNFCSHSNKYYPSLLAGVLNRVEDPEEEIYILAVEIHSSLLEHTLESPEEVFVEQLVDVVVNKLLQKGIRSVLRTCCLQWISMLLSKITAEINSKITVLYSPLVETLKDNDESVVIAALQVLAQMTFTIKGSFEIVVTKLLVLFAQTDERILDSRKRLIVRQLCSQVDSIEFFKTVSKVIKNVFLKKNNKNESLEEECVFNEIILNETVQLFNWSLLTAIETRHLREKILHETVATKNKNNEENCENLSMFEELLIPWLYCPMAAVSLCIWVEEYKLAYKLVERISQIEPSLSILTQIDQLIHLFEAPVFTRIRFHLMNPKKYKYLIKTVMGLGLILPQSTAFNILKNRLKIIQPVIFETDGETCKGQFDHRIPEVLQIFENRLTAAKYEEDDADKISSKLSSSV
eukprot:GHVL01030683.1.p1 GENE.GHVL01030683.1~~GHVL01030683.1.p1  ORF type:complete len:701 (+),score=130.02 GHVL01030683.1:58-2160(+)